MSNCANGIIHCFGPAGFPSPSNRRPRFFTMCVIDFKQYTTLLHPLPDLLSLFFRLVLLPRVLQLRRLALEIETEPGVVRIAYHPVMTRNNHASKSCHAILQRQQMQSLHTLSPPPQPFRLASLAMSLWLASLRARGLERWPVVGETVNNIVTHSRHRRKDETTIVHDQSPTNRNQTKNKCQYRREPSRHGAPSCV